ncbi:hypothetical protein GCM10027174_21350 [Salinifilum aidingensis]
MRTLRAGASTTRNSGSTTGNSGADREAAAGNHSRARAPSRFGDARRRTRSAAPAGRWDLLRPAGSLARQSLLLDLLRK